MQSEFDYILTISCPDRTGIVYSISGALVKIQGNILDSQQFGDPDTNRFFLRVHFNIVEPSKLELLKQELHILSDSFKLNWQLYPHKKKSKVLILVSKQGHCLNDLLFRSHSGTLPIEITAIASNHRDFEQLADSYHTPFHYLPVTADNRAEQEAEIIQLVEHLNIDLVVLARYMQVLSDNLCQALNGKAINIHHSFLPGFKGAKPYHQAYQRGVKIIGATAHYVTADLDEGPIIAQDVQAVNHSFTPEDLKLVGSDIESRVLARAVQYHVEHRILLNNHRTVIFE